MIQEFKIQNFQSHKKTTLEFHKGVNAIVGSSDSGKTAIARAFRWLRENKPSGDAFINHNATRANVSAKIDDTIITRIKSKRINGYIIDDKPLKALGKSGVPDEVKEVLNMSDINVQKQLDSSFLLSKSAGEVAKILNKTVDLDSISKALSGIESKRKKINTDIEYVSKDLLEKKKELTEFDFLSDMERDIRLTQRKVDKLEKLKSKAELLEDIIDKHDEIVVKQAESAHILIKEGLYKVLKVKHLKWLALKEKQNKLSQIIDDYEEAEISIEKLNKSIKLNQIKFNEAMPDVCPFDDICERGKI